MAWPVALSPFYLTPSFLDTTGGCLGFGQIPGHLKREALDTQTIAEGTEQEEEQGGSAEGWVTPNVPGADEAQEGETPGLCELLGLQGLVLLRPSVFSGHGL